MRIDALDRVADRLQRRRLNSRSRSHMECHRTSVVATERYVDMRTRRLQHIIANVADNADDPHDLFWLTESV